MSETKQLLFTREHVWVTKEDKGSRMRFGVSDYALRKLGELSYVEMPALGSFFAGGETLVTLESAKSASDVSAPFDCKVALCNTLLETKPETLNDDPYGEGWILELERQSADLPDSLMSADEYAAFTGTLE